MLPFRHSSSDVAVCLPAFVDMDSTIRKRLQKHFGLHDATYVCHQSLFVLYEAVTQYLISGITKIL